ncbi:MAG: S-methyl-5-thioribose-1-phosphate isomerase [Candidatus Omnitrophica bacterium]|nr:S-methyl-5-thioribose-1-phosphate isomerase [Candidatus Omnitrophota bacterium]
MRVRGKHYKTVWMNARSVFLIDQTLLPFRFKIVRAATHRDTCEAIRAMTVRGAGAIGAAAAFAMAQAFAEAPPRGLEDYARKARQRIESTRPTAQNLFYAVKRVFDRAVRSRDPKKAAADEAASLARKDEEDCRRIGEIGNALIKDGASVGTHCNAGWLAFVDYGTALSPVYAAARGGKKIFVYVDETRPRGQGARLTAWELRNERIPHAIIPDNAAAYFFSKKKIDLVIVGADRIAANGDAANKIGTLEKAVCAKEFGVPFYVAAPTSTFDPGCRSGEEIPIEERSEDEVLYQSGPGPRGKEGRIRVASPGSRALNPAFDVTPAKFLTGILTEKGILRPSRENVAYLFRGKENEKTETGKTPAQV